MAKREHFGIQLFIFIVGVVFLVIGLIPKGIGSVFTYGFLSFLYAGIACIVGSFIWFAAELYESSADS